MAARKESTIPLSTHLESIINGKHFDNCKIRNTIDFVYITFIDSTGSEATIIFTHESANKFSRHLSQYANADVAAKQLLND